MAFFVLNLCPTFFGRLGPPCLTPAFQATWPCMFKGLQNCRLALLVLLGFGLLGSPCLTPAFQAAVWHFWFCWCQPLPHLPRPVHSSKDSKLPGHVSFKGFETALWHFWILLVLRPAKASLPHSSLPSCLAMYLKMGFETVLCSACYGLLASLQPSKDSMLPKCFQSAVWHFSRPARASLRHSSLPSYLVMYV